MYFLSVGWLFAHIYKKYKRENKMIKYTKIMTLTALMLGAVPQSQAGAILPSGSCGISGSCLTYGDFNVYSMAFLNTVAGYGKPNGQDPYYISSSPGAIAGGVVFGTGASGTGLNENFSGMDDAYAVPNAAPNAEASFSTTLVTDPGTTFGTAPINDQAASWDADISALRGVLATNGGSFTPFFNLNETGKDNTLTSIDLQIWVHMWVEGEGLDTQHFYLTGQALELSGSGYTPLKSETGPNMNSPDDTDDQWTYVHGTICVNASTDTVLGTGACTDTQKAAGGADVDQNLGANNAAFAIYNADLDTIIKDSNSGYTDFHMDWRMIHENNGFEQAFLLTDTVFSDIPPATIPEPTILAMLGIGLLGISVKRRNQ